MVRDHRVCPLIYDIWGLEGVLQGCHKWIWIGETDQKQFSRNKQVEVDFYQLLSNSIHISKGKITMGFWYLNQWFLLQEAKMRAHLTSKRENKNTKK